MKAALTACAAQAKARMDMLPEGWKETTFNGLITIKHGFAFKSEFFTDKGKYAILTPGNFYENGGFKYNLNKQKYYNGSFSKCYLLKSGDLIIAMTEQTAGLVGSTAFVPQDNIFLHNQRIGLIDIIHPDIIDKNFVYFLYNFENYRKIIEKESSGTKVKHTSPDRLTNFHILLPPLPEQHKIVAVLSTWEKAISTTDALLANSRQQKKALMQQLLTGKRRLPGFTGEWKVIYAGSVIHEESTRNRGNKITRVLSVNNQKGFILPEEQFSKRVASDNIANYKIIKQGQFGFNPSRINVGSFGRLDTFKEGILSPLYVIFSIKDKYINSDFFLAWMHSEEIKQRIKGSSQGSVRESVSFNAIASFPLHLPPLDEQRAIAAVLDAADKEISLLEQKATRLREEKKALMQQLLTGKRRVRL